MSLKEYKHRRWTLLVSLKSYRKMVAHGNYDTKTGNSLRWAIERDQTELSKLRSQFYGQHRLALSKRAV